MSRYTRKCCISMYAIAGGGAVLTRRGDRKSAILCDFKERYLNQDENPDCVIMEEISCQGTDLEETDCTQKETSCSVLISIEGLRAMRK